MIWHFFLFFWSFSKSIVILMKWCIGLVCKWNFALVLIFNWNDLAFFFSFLRNFLKSFVILMKWLIWFLFRGIGCNGCKIYIKSQLFPIQLSSLSIYLKQPFLTQSIFQNFVIFRPPSQYFLLRQFYFKLLHQITLLSICHNEKEKMNYSNITANS